jgi:hypothetical protein
MVGKILLVVFIVFLVIMATFLWCAIQIDKEENKWKKK